MARVYTAADRELDAVVGEPIVLELESNPTTGYDWEIEFDESALRLVDREFEQASPGVGVGGRERFVLEPLVAGAVSLKAVLKRPWEDAALEERAFEVRAVAASPD